MTAKHVLERFLALRLEYKLTDADVEDLLRVLAADRRQEYKHRPSFGLNGYTNDSVSCWMELDFDSSFEVVPNAHSRIRFNCLLVPDLEQLELELTRHLKNVQRLRLMRRTAVKAAPEEVKK